uniref:Ciliary microtubule inner protein 3 n=1 Tax=Anser brachyrhynchus TaxID=132585 RepID=A0A8B9BUZ0_9AVES
MALVAPEALVASTVLSSSAVSSLCPRCPRTLGSPLGRRPRRWQPQLMDQPLASRFVPFVAHFGGREPDSFKFLFYTPSCSNSYRPFYTAQRPTCGYLYRHDTDHTRKVIDVPSANIVKWRPVLNTKP